MHNCIHYSRAKKNVPAITMTFSYKKILSLILILLLTISMVPSLSVFATTGTMEMEQSFTAPNTASAFAISDTNTYNVTFSLTSVDMVNPILVITVPKGIDVTYYPTASNATLAPTLISVNPVTKTTDAEGNSVITYKFRTDMTAIGFNITLRPTYKLDETSYTVSAQYRDGETVIVTKQASVTISENPTLSNNIMYFSNSLNSYVHRDGLNDYYAPCNSYIYYSPSRNYHYSYDYIEYTVPLPDQAVPGLGQGSSFSPFTEGVPYDIGSGTGAYSVKYFESYNYINASGTTIGTGKALVYTLPDTHSLTSGDSSYSFSQNIYLEISVSEPGEYSKNIRPQIKANAKGTDIILADYVNYSSYLYSNYYYYLIGAQIKVYNISDYLYAYNSYTYSPYVGYYILPVERNTSYLSYVYNKTEQTVTDLKVEYIFAKKLYVDKIRFNLDSSLTSNYPNNASVRYKTFLGGETIYEASFNADIKEFQLTDSLDAITWMEVTYNRLSHYLYGVHLMYAYMTNRDEVSSTGQITAKIISAEAGELGSIPTQTTTSYTFSLISSFATRTWQEISPITLNKGDTFRLNFRFSYDSAEIINPEYYVIMPSTYIFMGYTPSTAFQNIEYDLSVRDIGGGNTLYALKYNDNVGRNGNQIGYFLFKVGPAVPTTTVQTRKLPVAAYYQHDGIYYPYRTIYMYTDINDYDSDGSTTDKLAYAPDSDLTTVTINSVSAMTAQSYLTSSITEGENTTMQYRYNSTGSYKYYMYNGLQAGNDASDLVIDIAVPRKSASFLYNDTTYTSRFDAKLTGPVNLIGDLFANSTVLYKLDESEEYIADVSGSWNQVSDIRITTETGRSLTSTNSAVIEVPFAVDGFDSSTTTSHYAYFDTQMHYTLTSTGETVHLSRIEPNSLQAAYTNITGTVYKDFNANAVKDSNETSRSYNIQLYSGTSVQGSYLSSTYANSSTGYYSLGAICPGAYTLKVFKDSTEYYPAAGSFLFDNEGIYTFTLGYPTADQISNVNLGIISPRTLNLNFTSVKVLEGTTRNIVPVIDPVLSSGETSIIYSSSDETVVTVSPTGVLTYVSDGTATVTVTVPQLSGFAALEGEADTISKTVTITCQKPGCNITAAPYASLNGTNSSVTSHNIQLTRGSTSSQRFYYSFNRGGYCNAGHSNSRIVTWTIHDAGGTDAVMSSTTTGYYYSYDYEFATLSVSTPGTVILKATETWPHDSSLKPEDIYVTVNVYGQYDIFLPIGTGFTITPYISSSPVNHNGTYSFTVSLSAGYNQSDIIVKSNGTNLTLTDGRYSVSDITEDKSITIEGITPNIYTVTFNTNGGTINSNNVTSYTYSTACDLPNASDISRAGYTFSGWTLTESADDISYITSITNTEIGNKQYYAKWAAIPVVSPTSLLAGGDTAEYGYSYATIDTAVVAADGHTVLGYQWYSCNQDKSHAVAITGADTDEYSIPAGYNAGSYYYYCTVTIRRTDNSLTQTFDTDVVSFVVQKKALIATASANDKTYDGTMAASGSLSLAGILETDDVSATGVFTFTDANTGIDITVNVTSITLSGADSQNYSVNASASSSADIQKALLTASVGNYSKTYGQDNPSFSVSVTGFVNGETASTVSGYIAPSAYTTAAQLSDVNSYTISLTGGEADNYNFDISDTGLLTINQKTLTAVPSAANKEYSGTSATIGSISLDGIIGTDQVIATGDFNFSDPDAGEGKTVNVTNITLAGDDAYNYSVNPIAICTADISKVTLTAIIDNYTKTYGQINPSFYVTVTGFVNAETELTAAGYTAPTAVTAANQYSERGLHAIILIGGSADNYVFDISDTAVLSITRRQLTAIPSADGKTYNGNTSATGTIALEGIVGTDDVHATGNFVFTDSDAAESKQVHVTGITLSGTKADNYFINPTALCYADIDKALLSAAVADYTKIYGQANPVFAISLSGFVNGEDETTASGYISPSAITAASQYSDINTYAISITGGEADNYIFDISDTGILTVNKKMLLAVGYADNKIYDGFDSASGNILLEGIVNADDVTARAVFTFSDSNSGDGKLVNISAITLSGTGAGNYSVNTSAFCHADIQKALLTAAVGDYSKIYGQANPVFTVSVSGFVNGEDETTASGYVAPLASSAASDFSDVNTYEITISGGQADNYTFNESDTGNLEIQRKQITFTARAFDKEYDSSLRAYGSIILIGLVNNDIVNATAIFTFDSIFPGTDKTVTVADVLLYGTDADNYLLSSTSATVTATITYDINSGNDDGIAVYVNGQSETAAQASTKEEDGKKVTTITVDDDKIKAKLESEGNNSTVTILFDETPDTLISQLNGQTIKNMEDKEAVLEIKTSNIVYTIPASQINIDDVASKLEDVSKLSDIEVSVNIKNPPDDTVKIVQNTADINNYSIVIEPIQFSITCTSKSGEVEVTKFNSYVERLIAIPEGVDPYKITTGIVLNEDGSFTHVPTQIVIIEGKYYARINSLTNSVYSLIWNKAEFTDISGHWAEQLIYDMSSRLVVKGISEGLFAPSKSITRAEFADVIIRGLGLLRIGSGKQVFSDVTSENEYFDSISIGYDYGIINGIGNGLYDPEKIITREQAMLMLYRAMKITGLDTSMKSSDIARFNASFDDDSLYSNWSLDSAAACFKYGIIEGKGDRVSDPLDDLSRAESAAMIRRLLIAAGLI